MDPTIEIIRIVAEEPECEPDQIPKHISTLQSLSIDAGKITSYGFTFSQEFCDHVRNNYRWHLECYSITDEYFNVNVITFGAACIFPDRICVHCRSFPLRQCCYLVNGLMRSLNADTVGLIMDLAK